MVTVSSGVGNYNVPLYAKMGLRVLKKRLGLVGRVHTGYDSERQSFGKGDTIKLRRPSSFTVKDGTDTTVQSIDSESLSIDLSNHKQVMFAVPDVDIAYASQMLIDEHIPRAIDAVATDMELRMHQLYTNVGPYFAVAGTPTVGDVTGPRKVLRGNLCPVDDEANMFYVVDPTLEKGLLDISAFTQWQGSGELGANAQVRGMLGQRYGFSFFASNQVQTHTAGAITASAPKINGGGSAVAKGTTSITIDDGTLTGTVKAGDAFTISGDTTVYAITADASASGNAVAVTISPGLQVETADNAAVTFIQSALNSKVMNLAFHREAFAFAMAPLPMGAAQQSSAQVYTATEPENGVSLRVAIWWDGINSRSLCKVDALYGLKCLNPLLACRAAQ